MLGHSHKIHLQSAEAKSADTDINAVTVLVLAKVKNSLVACHTSLMYFSGYHSIALGQHFFLSASRENKERQGHPHVPKPSVAPR